MASKEITTIYHLHIDIWKCILELLNKPDIFMLLYTCKYIHYQVTSCEKYILLIDYLIEYYSPLKTIRRNKNVIPKYVNLYYSITHYIGTLTEILNKNGFPITENKICCKIIKYGHLKYTKSLAHLIQTNVIYDTMSLFEAAVSSGSIKKLKALFKSTSLYHDCYKICNLAASSGNLEMLKWLRTPKCYKSDHYCNWDENTTANAAKGGHLKLLKWAIDNGCEHDIRIKIFAEKYNHTHLQTLVNIFYGNDKEGPTKYAVKTGDMELFKWSLQNGYEWNSIVCEYAIKMELIGIIKTAYNLCYPIIPNICDVSCRVGNIEILKWAIENDFPLNTNNIIDNLTVGCIESCQYIINTESYGSWYGLGNSNINIAKKFTKIFEWLCLNKLNNDVYNKWFIDSFGNKPIMYEIIQMFAWYLTHTTEIPNIAKICDFAIGSQNLELLQWIHTNGFKLPNDLCNKIASVDRYRVPPNIARKMLMWAACNNYPLNSNICKAAAYNSDYEMLIWAVEYGCDINLDDNIGYSGSTNSLKYFTYKLSLYKHHNLELLKWMISNGFVWDDYTRSLAMYSLISFAFGK